MDDKRVTEIKEGILDLLGEFGQMWPGAEEWPITGCIAIGQVLSPDGPKMISLWSDDMSAFTALGLMEATKAQIMARMEGG